MVTGQQWLDFAAMVDCPEFCRGASAAIPDRAMGLPRLDPGAHRPVDAGAHRRGDRRPRTAVQAAAGPTGKRRDDPRDGPPARARRVRGQPGRFPATAPAVADVGRRAVADSSGTRDRRLRQRILLGTAAVRTESDEGETPLAGLRVVDSPRSGRVRRRRTRWRPSAPK